MKIRTAEYYVQEVFRSLRRNNWMTFAAVGTVAVSLFILGVFLILALNMNRAASMLESQVQISVYMQDELTEDEEETLGAKIRALQGIESVKYVGREEARKRLSERLGEQKYLLDALGDKNPLPNAYEVTVRQPDMVETAAKQIERMDGVESAKYGQDVVEHLFDITRLVRIFGVLLILLLGGATDEFIRWPFVLEGIVLGCIGGMISAFVLRSFYAGVVNKVYDTLAFFPLIPQSPFMTYVSIVIVLLGMAIGAAGAWVSLKRFLKV